MLFGCFSHVQLFATPWTVAHQAPLSMGFSRQEHWSGFPCPPPGDLPSPGIERTSPAWQMDSLPLEPPEKLCIGLVQNKMYLNFVWSQSIFFLLKKRNRLGLDKQPAPSLLYCLVVSTLCNESTLRAGISVVGSPPTA